jgi:3-isopropylmalate dehydrogenase
MMSATAQEGGGSGASRFAVRQVIAAGLRTADIYTPGTFRVDTAGMGDAIAAAL